MKRTASQLGRMKRTKGRAYEQAIARMLRARWPHVEVRRATQSERAYESDVFITGEPRLERLWLELQDARHPNPLLKLAQAERDCGYATATERGVRGVRGVLALDRQPVVVWHKLRERTIHVTTRAWVFDELRNSPSSDNTVITMELGAFLDVVGREAA